MVSAPCLLAVLFRFIVIEAAVPFFCRFVCILLGLRFFLLLGCRLFFFLCRLLGCRLLLCGRLFCLFTALIGFFMMATVAAITIFPFLFRLSGRLLLHGLSYGFFTVAEFDGL